MTDNTENLVLEHLRAIRTTQDFHSQELQDIKQRITSLESHVALLHGDFSNQSRRMDRIEQREERIERHLELHDNTT
jgi:hypothetical protein